MTPLQEALDRLAKARPGALDVHYVDEVRRVCAWALRALQAAEAALAEKEKQP